MKQAKASKKVGQLLKATLGIERAQRQREAIQAYKKVLGNLKETEGKEVAEEIWNKYHPQAVPMQGGNKITLGTMERALTYAIFHDLKSETKALAQVANIEQVSLYLAGADQEAFLAWPDLMDELWSVCPVKKAEAMVKKFAINQWKADFPKTKLRLNKMVLEEEVHDAKRRTTKNKPTRI